MKNKMKYKIYFFTAFVFLFAFGCTQSAIYDNSYSFQDNTWHKKDTALFVVSVEDTMKEHAFYLSLRTSTQYLYSNLWVYIGITAPDGTSSKVAHKIPVAHPNGAWTGKVSGTLVESRLHLGAQKFPLKGDYVFQITNATQENEIPFVEDISLRIE